MGLREDKKQRVRVSIIENAIALFRERGFDATRVQDIARPLQLSDATFFNYFATKDAVLTEWVRDQVQDAFRQASESRPERVRSAGRAAARGLAERMLPDAEFLRGVWPRLRQSAAVAPRAVVDLLAAGQARGELRRDLPAAQLADVLVAGMLAAMAGWLAECPKEAGDPPSKSDLGRRLQGVVDLVLDGSRRRNERVRAPAAGSRTLGGRPLNAGPG